MMFIARDGVRILRTDRRPTAVFLPVFTFKARITPDGLAVEKVIGDRAGNHDDFLSVMIGGVKWGFHTHGPAW
ncbi:hypothetical protein LAD77_29955 [Klebsiella pneumoniae]|nr:hypothetical protein [Klebsiella pneumoniae]